ncbi:enamine deaminase RidA (YjgF/YER057c/UK114 family) [Sinorhizobium kostiense]|uniref:Enamine deaminase RidA (YjgF/YER057c/UK114 family) n=1 Tax=Sinorhizobium kostiense TaxID=76747 RepID=A0ABS4R9Q2_9HYPH|nr:RidA family protein [Sinorhizobium kostiense]MBP2239039.1 enamine deaminase RidA (YjgF/YER057c/UK114 family) [Sinorhizobium kostiense]
MPNGNYVLAKRHHDVVFTSGMTPRANGILTHTGTFTNDVDLEDCKEAVELAASNAMAAARRLLNGKERIDSILAMTVFVSASGDFNQHSRIADHASNYLFRELGERGIGVRAAVGVASLPGGAIVEIQITASVADG